MVWLSSPPVLRTLLLKRRPVINWCVEINALQAVDFNAPGAGAKRLPPWEFDALNCVSNNFLVHDSRPVDFNAPQGVEINSSRRVDFNTPVNNGNYFFKNQNVHEMGRHVWTNQHKLM